LASADRTRLLHFEMALTRQLEQMSTEELQEFRTRYTEVVSAGPKLIEQVLADEERADPELKGWGVVRPSRQPRAGSL
jgi:hypothetical protein